MNVYRMILLLLAFSTPALDSRTIAADLLYHTQAHIEGRGSAPPPGDPPYYNMTLDGTDSVELGPEGPVISHGSGNGNQTVTAYARTTASSGQLLRISATSYNDKAGGFTPTADSISSVAWRDIIYLNNQSNPPASLRLNFLVSGSLMADVFGVEFVDAFGRAELGLLVYPYVSFLATADFSSYSFHHYAEYRKNFFEAKSRIEGFTSLIGDLNGFTATFEFDAPYDPVYGGYTWNLIAMARTQSAQGTASANFGSTLQLTNVIGPGGVQLTGSDIRFDSGMQFTVVPEPSSLLLTIIGPAVLLLFSRKKAVCSSEDAS